MFRSIRWRIAIPFLLLILISMGGLTSYLSQLVNRAYVTALQTQLFSEARLLASDLPFWQSVAGDLAVARPGGDELQNQVLAWSNTLNLRITLIAGDGTVLAESHEDPRQMENHLFRKEVQRALNEDQGTDIRVSRTLQEETMYTAVPLMLEGEIVGVIRLAVPLRTIDANVRQLRQTLLGAAAVMTLFALGTGLIIAERTARPIRQLTYVARRLAGGDLDARLYNVRARDEIRDLTLAFNQMGDQLRLQIHSLADGQRRLRAILDNMAGGVIITDGDGRVSLVNPAARHLLQLRPDEPVSGRSFTQVVRHYQLVELWQQGIGDGQEHIATLELGTRGIFLQMIVTPLRETGPQSCLVILQDLTRIRRLELVRRDFISNISHELRTPLASLKALVETLRDTTLDDPPATLHFLDQTETEVDALSQLVQELLELSRIESGQAPLRLQPTSVANILLPTVERFAPQAERMGLELIVDLPRHLPPVLADEDRIQQVVRNLVHNALKFTLASGKIFLRAIHDEENDDVIISVRDSGVGIPSEDLPRIFERFYKSDRARRGGGTGLGLAIARHMVQAHGGRIWVKSKENKGSTFFFTLPAAHEHPQTPS